MSVGVASSATATVPLVQAQIVVSIGQAAVAVRGSLTNRGMRDDSLLLKTALTEAFGGALIRPWRLMGVRDNCATVLGYTNGVEAEQLRSRLALAMPALQQAVSVVATAPMPVLDQGQLLRFSTRMVPTIRQTSAGEIDAFLYAVRRAPDARHERAQVYTDYLNDRLSGAKVGSVSMKGMQLTPMLRRDGKKGWTERTFPVAEMSGTLEVTDSAVFVATLAKGVGRQKAYGYGLVRLEALRG